MTQPAEWNFLTNYGQALLCIAADPGVRLRDIADRVGITERATHRIVSTLVESGYVARTRNGRRNTYEVRADLPLKLPIERDVQLGDLLQLVGAQSASEGDGDGARVNGSAHTAESVAAG